MTQARHFVLAAGGTGGHMVPAAALAAELTRRGHHVALISDERGVRFPGLFEDIQTHVLPAGRLAGGPIGWARAALPWSRPGDGDRAVQGLSPCRGDRVRRLSGVAGAARGVP